MITLARLILASGFAAYLAAGWLALSPAGQSMGRTVAHYIGRM
jgi:hypothetical protein